MTEFQLHGFLNELEALLLDGSWKMGVAKILAFREEVNATTAQDQGTVQPSVRDQTQIRMAVEPVRGSAGGFRGPVDRGPNGGSGDYGSAANGDDPQDAFEDTC